MVFDCTRRLVESRNYIIKKELHDLLVQTTLVDDNKIIRKKIRKNKAGLQECGIIMQKSLSFLHKS